MTQTVTTLDNGDKQIIITGTSASPETWAFPSDWNDYANKIEAYGAGGNGVAGLSSRSGGGGGGGAYHSVSNFPLKLYSETPNPVNGQKVALISSSIRTDSSGGLWLYIYQGVDDTDPESPQPIYLPEVPLNNGQPGFGALGGVGGSAIEPNIIVAATATTSAATYTTVQFAGGTGGSGRTNTAAAGGGGGGAGGPNGAGGAGGTNTTTLGTTGRGGGGGNGGTAGSGTSATGGTAGTGAGAGGTGGAASTSGSAGGAGTNVASTYVFSGGGGGGAGDGTGTTVGGAGGLYGAGGGGGASSVISTGGLGSIGALIITYTPIVVSASNKFFLMF
jgi:hypothetical protein